MPVTEINPEAGEHIFDVLVDAVHRAPARFAFNGWNFETREGEPLDDARQRFKVENGVEVNTPEHEIKEAFRRHDEATAAQEKAIADAGVANGSQMAEMKAPYPKTVEELNAYISTLVDRPQSYGTCVYAMSLAAAATFNFVARKLGVTGFQASCADLDILRQTRGFTWGKLLDYEKLLWPQYCTSEHFPSLRVLLSDPRIRERLKELAVAKLAESGDMAPAVRSHMEAFAAYIPAPQDEADADGTEPRREARERKGGEMNCRTCDGTGWVVRPAHSLDGIKYPEVVADCPDCCGDAESEGLSRVAALVRVCEMIHELAGEYHMPQELLDAASEALSMEDESNAR